MADNIDPQKIQQNSGVYPSYTSKEIKRTIEKLCAPVFDFFKKEDKENQNQDIQTYTDFEEKLTSEEKKMAMFKEIMDDADPTARAKINFNL